MSKLGAYGAATAAGALVFLGFAAGPAQAAVIDLGHPSIAPFLATNVGNGVDRGTVFDVDSTFSISSAGIRFDPLVGGATSLAVDIYASQLGISSGHGALLATATASVTDAGLAFYNVPISFTFLAGSRYDVAFRPVGSDWGFGLNNMEFYNFDFSTPFSVGPITVLDGSCHPVASCAGYGNTVMPHIQLDSTAEPVPEPGTMLLLGSGLAALAARRRRTS